MTIGEKLALIGQALDGKIQLQYKNKIEGRWKDSEFMPMTGRLVTIDLNSIDNNYEYRIKPKPREFYILQTDNGIIVNVTIEKPSTYNMKDAEIIHVKEIID